ncbi:MAG: c-type cytochrome [Burkholderiales bacterium]
MSSRYASGKPVSMRFDQTFIGMSDKANKYFPCAQIPKRLAQLVWAAALAVPVISHEAIAQGAERGGKDVVETVCITCHGTGAQGAPKIGDRKAWSKRASQGLTSLTAHALGGIRQMPAHGGNPNLTDLEIARAITYMVNRSGGRWVEPVSAKDMTAERSGEQIVMAQCAKCHQTGEGGAPRIGDRDAWTPRMKQGLDYLVRSAIKGHGGMPARGGMADTTDAEIRNAVLYMFNPRGAVAGESQKASAAAKSAAAAPPKPADKRVTVGGMDVYLGLMSAEALRAYPSGAVERSMHGGIPRGAGYYHVNVSLFDATSGAAITDAQVEVQVDEPGMTSESKKLEPMVINNAPSYGDYFRMRGEAAYLIAVRIRKPTSAQPIEAKFEHRIN